MTNRDTLDDLDNMELAMLLGKGCPPDVDFFECHEIDCVNCWLKWLNEVKDGD